MLMLSNFQKKMRFAMKLAMWLKLRVYFHFGQILKHIWHNTVPHLSFQP